MRIHVISLPRSSDRRAHIDRQIGRHGLDRSFFDAIDGDRGRQAFDRCDERQFRINVARPVTSGEIGCFASHRLLWRECADSDQPLLIMEDDATLERHFPAALEFARRHIHRYGFLRFQTEWPSKRMPATRADDRGPGQGRCTMAGALTAQIAHARRCTCENAVQHRMRACILRS